jgi:hypothetical protein
MKPYFEAILGVNVIMIMKARPFCYRKIFGRLNQTVYSVAVARSAAPTSCAKVKAL